MGAPLDRATVVGPLITTEARERVAEWVQEAQDAGATKLVGDRGEHGHLGPVVLDGVESESKAWQDESFKSWLLADPASVLKEQSLEL